MRLNEMRQWRDETRKECLECHSQYGLVQSKLTFAGTRGRESVPQSVQRTKPKALPVECVVIVVIRLHDEYVFEVDEQ
jgi:hypothetical protein